MRSLSHVLSPSGVSLYPGDPECSLEQVASLEREGYALNRVSFGEHTGTHWGAPAHFNAGEACADELVPEAFFLPGVLIDVGASAGLWTRTTR